MMIAIAKHGEIANTVYDEIAIANMIRWLLQIVKLANY